jgi:vacuolar-type H+-ATPase subunit E/Vma4
MELFSKIVLDKVRKEYSEAMKELESHHEEKRQEKIKELDKQSQDYSREMKQRALNERKKIISKAKGQARKNILIKKEELYLKLKDRLVHEVRTYCDSEVYGPFVVQRIHDNKSELLQLNNALIVICRAQDQELIKKGFKENGIDNEITCVDDVEILGGFIVIDKIKGIKINMSINSVIDEHNVYIGSLIHDLLEKEGDLDE